MANRRGAWVVYRSNRWGNHPRNKQGHKVRYEFVKKAVKVYLPPKKKQERSRADEGTVERVK